MIIKMSLENVFKLIKILVFLGFIAIFLYVGVFEVWSKYSKGSTNFETTKERVEFLDSPTFMLCFKPQNRRSVMSEYNLTGNYFSFINQIPGDSRFLEQYYSSSYILGQDYDIQFSKLLLGQPKNLQIGANEFIDYFNKTNIIQVQNHSTFSYGLCSKITPYIKHSSMSDIFVIIVNFKDTLPKEDIPNSVEFIITSEANSYGAGMSIWREGQEFVQSVQIGQWFLTCVVIYQIWVIWSLERVIGKTDLETFVI